MLDQRKSKKRKERKKRRSLYTLLSQYYGNLSEYNKSVFLDLNELSVIIFPNCYVYSKCKYKQYKIYIMIYVQKYFIRFLSVLKRATYYFEV